MRYMHTRLAAVATMSLAALVIVSPRVAGQEGFKFKSGVELINVNATVTDRSGRFVAGLQQSDFVVYEDEQPVEITHFSAERVPVSLGIVLDTSGSMAGDKMTAAKSAIERFLLDLLTPDDEVFLYTFSSGVDLVHQWTTERDRVAASLRRVHPAGGTAMYDAVVEAVPMAHGGQNRKKAIVVVSDGNDTNSRADVRDVKQSVRETEVLVYAVGIDGNAESTLGQPRTQPPILRPPRPIPFPIPGGGQPRNPWPVPPQYPPSGGVRSDDRLNVAALREMTDDSGGRTEIVRDPRDLGPATTSIADELSKQYYIGYPSLGKRDGKWHTIRVELRNPSLRVRARRGYLATP
jgi:Ca-activated chloride channel family protein